MQNENLKMERITKITKLGTSKTIDVVLDGDRLFFANDILTHNSGINNSDIELTDTSESIGLPATLDFYCAMIPTAELDEMNLIMCKILKNRWGDLAKFRRFTVGKNFARMQFYDTDNPVAGMMEESRQREDAQSKDQFNNFKPSKFEKFEGKNFDGINFD